MTGAILFILLVPLCALIYTSAWLNGGLYFWAIQLLSAAWFVVFAQQGDFKMHVAALIGFLFLFHIVGSRYITSTKFMDTTYQSYGELKGFISNKGTTGIFDLCVLNAGLLAAISLCLGAITSLVVG